MWLRLSIDKDGKTVVSAVKGTHGKMLEDLLYRMAHLTSQDGKVTVRFTDGSGYDLIKKEDATCQ